MGFLVLGAAEYGIDIINVSPSWYSVHICFSEYHSAEYRDFQRHESEEQRKELSCWGIASRRDSSLSRYLRSNQRDPTRGRSWRIVMISATCCLG